MLYFWQFHDRGYGIRDVILFLLMRSYFQQLLCIRWLVCSRICFLSNKCAASLSRSPISVLWNFHSLHGFKVNVDGSRLKSTGFADAGVVFHNDLGIVIVAKFVALGQCSSVVAEL